ncbi:MAG: NYN domain-containing protein [Patescibacteria group bacterium]
MIKHKEQRVGVFVDVANMYHSAKNIFQRRVDFGQVLKEAVAGRKLIRAIAYAIKTKTGEEDMFLEALEKQGFEVHVKDLQIFLSGMKKADWDVGMAVDAIRIAPKLDVVVLVTGDGDFAPLVRFLRDSMGCVVEIMAFQKTCSSKLLEEADGFTDLIGSRKFLK